MWILSFFKNPRFLLAIGIIAILAYASYTMHSIISERDSLRLAIHTKKIQIAELNNTVDTLNSVLTIQNDKITDYHKKSIEQEKRIALSKVNVIKIKSSLAKSLVKLEKESTGKTCNDTMNWLISKGKTL